MQKVRRSVIISEGTMAWINGQIKKKRFKGVSDALEYAIHQLMQEGEEKQLKALVDSKVPIDVIAVQMKKTYAAVLKKCERLGLEVDDTKRPFQTSTSIPMPKDLPSIEEALKKLAGALQVACKAGLSKVEVQRLQVVG